MAALPAVGVGLSALSTVSQIGQQRRQARAQQDLLDNQAHDAQTRLALAKENWQYTAEAAQGIKDKELALNVAQRKQAMAQTNQQLIEQQLASVQAKVEAGGIKSQAAQASAQLMTQAAQQQAQTSLQNANELSQVSGALNQENPAAAGKNQVSLAQQQNALLAGADLAGRVNENAQLRTGQANQQTAYNASLADQAKTAGSLQAGYIQSTDALQQQATQLGVAASKKQVNLTSSRNKLGIIAAYKGQLANGTLDYLNQSIDTQGTMNQIAAQRASIQKPGFLSYLGAGVQAGVGAYTSGLLGGRGNNSGYGTTKLGGINSVNTSGAAYNSGLIGSYNTANYPVQNINYTPDINQYPPYPNASVANNA